ncbi:MAG: nucleotidyl transferase AbiEii/AbiGii toxin family protein [Candidatus Gastranaerophilales bacterium]|nr:nucleotidyl transferase AbiEii/AbiGii toxin family protein [Candidatus Gastranaerophilales bacterium]
MKNGKLNLKDKMKQLHQHEDFKYFIQEASKQVGLGEFVIEKDYWVTYLLKNLAKSIFADEIVFKGGTCLAKAYDLIERFSEDIDLLIIETEQTKSKTQKEKRLKALRKFASTLEFLSYKPIKNDRSTLHGAFHYEFPTTIASFSNAIGKEILLEPGYRGGIYPEIEKKFITSYVEKLVHLKLNDYDTKPFLINVLSLERIFVEKLFALKEIYDKDNGKTLVNKTRHYYDIYELLKSSEIQLLLENKEKLNLIVNDINQIGQKYFSLKPIYLSELLNHIAINPDDTFFKSLKKGYTNDKELYKNPLAFDEIIEKMKVEIVKLK